MHAYQWFLLGIMVAYTPGLIILAFMLRDIEVDASEQYRLISETTQATNTTQAAE
jgi:hypothetical protein